jgi:predicted MFS family arabinose efflux permease
MNTSGWLIEGANTNTIRTTETSNSPIFQTFFMIVVLLSQFALVGTFLSQVPHLQDIGIPITTVATALGGIGLASAFSKLFFGWLCDLIKSKYAFALGVFSMAVGTFLLMAIEPKSPLFIIWVYLWPWDLEAGAGCRSFTSLLAPTLANLLRHCFLCAIFDASLYVSA